MYLFMQKTGNLLFVKQLEFRVRLFNILACGGMLSSLMGIVYGLIIKAGVNTLLLNAVLAVFAASLLLYSLKSGNYQRCYVITIIVVFFILFPAVFLNLGGYSGGIPMFFVFAVLFTVFMIEGKKVYIFAGLELILYTSLFVFAYYNPEIVKRITNETVELIDNIVCFLIVSVVLGLTMALHFNLYNQQQNELIAARKKAEEHAKIKSELFAGMSHEMRTPLTVMSAYAQFAVEQIRESEVNEQTLADLSTISEEAKRLAEMADGTLKILLSTSDPGETNERAVRPVNIGDLAKRLTHLLKPFAMQKNRKLTISIKDDLPEIHGNADELTQLLWNIIQNAITHSCGIIELAVNADETGVAVTVKDDGEGIKAELLPHIFERGIVDDKGGSGLGLSICRDIARSHGGDITVQSEFGVGTCVSVTLKGKAEGFDV